MSSLSRHRLTPGWITLLYAGFAALWIITSDEVLNFVTADPTLMGRINIIKGLAFVIVTAGLLYLLLCGWCESLITADAGDAGNAAIPKLQRRYWVLTLISLALLAPLLGFGLVLLHGPQLEHEAYANVEAIVALKANQINYLLAERQGDGDALAADPALPGRWIGSCAKATLRSVMRLWNGSQCCGWPMTMKTWRCWTLKVSP